MLFIGLCYKIREIDSTKSISKRSLDRTRSSRLVARLDQMNNELLIINPFGLELL